MVEVSYDQHTLLFSVTFPDVLQYVKQLRWDSPHQPTRTRRLGGEYTKEGKKINQKHNTAFMGWPGEFHLKIKTRNGYKRCVEVFSMRSEGHSVWVTPSVGCKQDFLFLFFFFAAVPQWLTDMFVRAVRAPTSQQHGLWPGVISSTLAWALCSVEVDYVCTLCSVCRVGRWKLRCTLYAAPRGPLYAIIRASFHAHTFARAQAWERIKCLVRARCNSVLCQVNPCVKSAGCAGLLDPSAGS